MLSFAVINWEWPPFMPSDRPLQEINPETARAWLDACEAVLLDVREASEFDFENVPGSVLLPLSFLDTETFPPLGPIKIILLCAQGKRSRAAQKLLAQSGLKNVFNLAGGLHAWKNAGLETQGGKFEALDYNI